MTGEKRPYRKRRRAELELQTRRRITESAVELHGTLGPARTSMSAVAEHAGVRRSTLYRHFADEAALFAACSAHWVAANPPPDLDRWAATADCERRLRSGLQELYAYYRRNERMFANLIRDEQTVAVVGERFAGFRRYIATAERILARGRRASRLGRAAIAHALEFTTWRSLAQHLDDARAAELMCRLVEAADSTRTPAT